MHLHVLCFPHAGGGASSYRALPAVKGWQWLAVQLPAREDRMREPPLREMSNLMDHLLPEVEQKLTGPLVLYGHSMGAWVALELASRLRCPPVLLVVSGSKAPHRPRRPDWHVLPEQELTQKIMDLSGTPAAVFQHPELRQLLLPTLQADLQLVETHHPVLRPLPVPILALAGQEDAHASPDELVHWQAYTTQAFQASSHPGGHFFNRPLLPHLPDLIIPLLPPFTRGPTMQHRLPTVVP